MKSIATDIMNIINDFRIVLIMTLSLGLAPFFPEPHIWGKVLWIAGGAKGMGGMDWFDFFFHGAPWFLLIRLGILKLMGKYPSATRE
jgi:hypothetical protein